MAKLIDFQNIVDCTRRLGNTSWIIDAALNNPKVIIIVRNAQARQNLVNSISIKYKSKNIFWKFKHNFFHITLPVIVTIDEATAARLKVNNSPVIFDNSCF